MHDTLDTRHRLIGNRTTTTRSNVFFPLSNDKPECVLACAICANLFSRTIENATYSISFSCICSLLWIWIKRWFISLAMRANKLSGLIKALNIAECMCRAQLIDSNLKFKSTNETTSTWQPIKSFRIGIRNLSCLQCSSLRNKHHFIEKKKKSRIKFEMPNDYTKKSSSSSGRYIFYFYLTESTLHTLISPSFQVKQMARHSWHRRVCACACEWMRGR